MAMVWVVPFDKRLVAKALYLKRGCVGAKVALGKDIPGEQATSRDLPKGFLSQHGFLIRGNQNYERQRG